MPQLVKLQGYQSSGELTAATTAIKASKGQLGGFCLYDITQDAILTLYDDPDSADGTILAKVGIDFDTGHFSMTTVFAAPINFALGCTAKVEGTNALAYVYYR